MNTLTLEDLLPSDWGDFTLAPFEPCASYSVAMDCLVYLRQDVSYRADRIDQFLTILWHPSTNEVVGVKIKGCRFLFNALQEIVKSTMGRSISDDGFVPLVGAIRLALEMQAGSTVSEELEKNRADRFSSLQESYKIASELVGDTTVEPRRMRVGNR